MKLPLCRLLCTLAIATMAVSSPADAAITLVKFGFDAVGGGNNIDESAGWDGTTLAAGGELATNVSLVSSLKVAGGYIPGSGTDVFHVDDWHSVTTQSAAISSGKNVNFTIAPQAGYQLDLEGGSLVTLLHSHGQGGDAYNVFNKVALVIGSVVVGSQDYVHTGTNVPTAQTLTWNIANGSGLNGLTGNQDIKFYFWDSTGTFEPGLGDSQHGAQWDTADGAYIQLNGALSAVPEPSRVFLGLCSLAFCFFRRRR